MIENFLLPSLILVASVVSKVVLVQFVMSLLFAFNVISPYHNVFGAIWSALNAILDPMLNPIRRHLPATGGVDFSPLVLIVLIQILIYFLNALSVMG